MGTALRRRVVQAPFILAVLVSLLPAASFAASLADVELVAPAPGGTVEAGVPVRLEGLVRDAVVSGTVVRVFVSVQRPDGRWLQSNGSWGVPWAARGARVGAPVDGDAEVRSWSLELPGLRAGQHRVNLQVVEPDGRKREYVRTSIQVVEEIVPPAPDGGAGGNLPTDPGSVYAESVTAIPLPGGGALPSVEPGSPVLFVAPHAVGTGDGSGPEAAAPVERVPELLREIGPGGEVRLLTEHGPYRAGAALVLDAGGSDAAPVVIRGADADGGEAAPATFVGDRSRPWALDLQTGPTVWRLSQGADHLVFRNLAFIDTGQPFSYVGDVRDQRLENLWADNFRRFVQNEGVEPATATVTGFSARHVVLRGFSRNAFWFGGASSDIHLEHIDADAQRQDLEAHCEGVSLRDQVHDVVIRHVVMRNCHDSAAGPSGYWNGDGFVTERGVTNVLLEDTVSTGHTDGGYDLKSTSTRLVRTYAADNKRNYRTWSSVSVADCVSRAPRWRGGSGEPALHLWATSGTDPAVVTYANCHLVDTPAGVGVVAAGGQVSVVVSGGRVERSESGPLADRADQATITFSDVEPQVVVYEPGLPALTPSETDDVAPGTSGAAPTRVTTPVKQASYAAAETITVTGRSEDRSAGPPPGVGAVHVQVADVDRGGYVGGDGARTDAPVTFEADAVNEVEGTLATATWSWQLPADLPPGLYEVRVRAVDVAGNLEARWQTRRFTVGHASGDAFVTILLGRSIYSYSTRNDVCPDPVTGDHGRVLTLDEVAERLAARPRAVPLTGNVYLELIREDERSCGTSDRSYPSWSDLERYRDDYGWTFVSGGYDYTNLVTATFPLRNRLGEVATLEENICGSLSVFAERGFLGADGLFPYPNNKRTDSMQRDVTSTCYSFGRQYDEDPTVRDVPVLSQTDLETQLWYQRTMSVTGGNCSEASGLPCATLLDQKQYDRPQRMRDLIDVESGTWATLQFYTFAEGSRTEGDWPRWNCEGPESEHWTSVSEMYCWNDFVSVLDAIPEEARVVDPAMVADAWGRSPG